VRIVSIDPIIVGNPWKDWVFTRVQTDEGLTGFGEGSLNGFAKTVAAAIGDLSELVIGKDPTQIEALTRSMHRDYYSDGGQIHGAAAASIEIALWDILGKSLGVPCWQLFGGQVRERIRAYANGWYRTERTPDDFAAAARGAVGRGYTALKVDPFGKAWRRMEPLDLGLSMDIVAAIREAVGPNVELMIEGHGRFSVDQAVQIAERLAPHDPAWFEEPIRHHRARAMSDVVRRSPVPIATGESFHTLGEFAELGSAGGVAFWQPEAGHLGGLGPLKQVAALAEAFDASVAPHQAGGPIATLVCLSLAACTSNVYIHEHFDAFNEPWGQELVSWSPVLDSEGCLAIPRNSGIGADLNVDQASKHPMKRGHYLSLFEDGWERRGVTAGNLQAAPSPRS
jgi:galactonate dehydratase